MMSSNYNHIFISVAILISIDKVVSNDLQIDQIIDLKSAGGIGCILATHTQTESCKNNYLQRMTSVLESGNSMQSEEYRKEYCCGFWSLRDCIADSIRQKCEFKSAKAISNTRIYSTEQEKVFHKNCDGFEFGSKQCGNASTQSISVWTLIVGLFISVLIRR